MAARTASAKNKNNAMSGRSLGGFTIIEVVLVLAIAGLIFLMVFIALPQLQRAQRDTQRRNDMSRLQSAITQYQTNNNGRLPSGKCVVPDDENPKVSAIPTDAADSSACRLIKVYLHGTGSDLNTFVDPDGTTYDLEISALASGADGSSMVDAADMDHIVHMYTHATCDGETAKYAQNARDYALVYKLEGSGTYCHGSGD